MKGSGSSGDRRPERSEEAEKRRGKTLSEEEEKKGLGFGLGLGSGFGFWSSSTKPPLHLGQMRSGEGAIMTVCSHWWQK